MVRPVANKLITAWFPRYNLGTLYSSKLFKERISHRYYLQSLYELFTNLVVVVWGLSDKEFVVLGCASQVIVVKMRKDFANSIHVFDEALFDGMFNSEDVLLGGDFISDVAVFLVHSDERTLRNRLTDHHWDPMFGLVIAGETSFKVA